jgi:hypothetical protein
MDEYKERNAKITGTMLGTEDHGILSCFVYLEWKGAGQGFGGYCLDTPIKDGKGKFKCRQGTAYGMEFISRILRTVGVDKWEDLKGKHCRIRSNYSKIKAIGHIIDDVWFEPEVDLLYLVEEEIE